MKKAILLLFVVLIPLGVLGCTGENTLSVLNWGEYINSDMVDAFEEEYGVKVRITIAESNESMEQKIQSGTTKFDIVIPSDYMIEKLWDDGYLQAIDLTKLTNYNADNFVDGISSIMDKMYLESPEVDNPFTISIPYFWGLFGIMYNTTVTGLQNYIETNGWGAILEPEPTGLFDSPLRVAMYDVSRFAYSLSLIYADEQGLIDDPLALNTASSAYMTVAEQVLSLREYELWGTDMIKKDIEAGNLDLGFTYVGDFFDTFLILTEGLETAQAALDAAAHIGIFIPETTMAFFDGMIIPANARNVDLAHKFIDFFLRPDVAYENSGIVGYTTVLKAVYQMIETASEGDLIRSIMVQNFPYNPTQAQAEGAIPLIAFSNTATDDITAMVTRVKSN